MAREAEPGLHEVPAPTVTTRAAWVAGARPRTLAAGVAPVLVGTAAAPTFSAWRFAAALVVALLLTVIVAMTAMVTAYILNVGRGTISQGAYLNSFVAFSQPTDFLLAEFKALVFGFIATIVAAHKGLSASGGPKGVADAVNQSVVLSVILLAVVNVGITQAYVMLVPQGIA